MNATPSSTAPGAAAEPSSATSPRLRLLPGALLPAPWLGGGLLHERLPRIRQALAEGRLCLQALPLPIPADGDWAHDRWLRGHPALTAAAVPTGAMAAVRTFAAAQPSFRTGDAPAPATPQASAPQASAEPAPAWPDTPATAGAPGWLLQPVAFRLTTDRMMLDPSPQAAVDATMATRMIQAIAPLLAGEGYTVEAQAPARWLLRPTTADAPGWQLSCTPMEAVGEQHIDELMPQGADARRFLRLLNEVQMSWHLLTLHEPQDLPVNAVWPSGPAHPPAIAAMRDLLAQGLVVDERFLAARLAQDLSAWLDALPGLDAWFAEEPGSFACLLAGEHGLHWLHAPDVSGTTLQLAGLALRPDADGSARTGPMPHPGAAGRSGASGRATGPNPAPAGGTRHAASGQAGRTAGPADTRHGWLARLGSRLRAPWQAWRQRAQQGRGGHGSGRTGASSQGDSSADPLDSLFRDEAP